ncbi:secretory pathway protein Sec39-domain-containing protein [Crassisporium funariophilum]|nr:secretory pathway protein Sec39-domain-containing protein [Crassisporium funariophilum]
MATQWTSLQDSELTPENIHQTLDSVADDVWVASACVDRALNDTVAQHTLLTLGLSRTDRVVESCNDVLALASPSRQHPSTFKHDTLVAHFRTVPADAQLCALRSTLLRRLDRLNTYVEMEKEFLESYEMDVDEEVEEWEDDPWADGAGASAPRSTGQTQSTSPPPISLSDFLQNDLVWSACELGSFQALAALRILFRKHTSVLWPYRFKVLECIPEHTHPSLCRDIFPTLDSQNNLEAVTVQDKWRPEPDFSELVETQTAVNDSNAISTNVNDTDTPIDCTPTPNPLNAEEISTWYKNRVNGIISSTGMVDVALSLVQHGASQGIPYLDELGEELSLLSRLVYDAPQGQHTADDWTLSRWYSMEPLAVVRAYLAHSTPKTLSRDISRLVMPYLFVLETRAERAGSPDPTLPNRILHEYILSAPLQTAAAVFDASKPTLPTAQRIIKNDEDMARVALACMYGSDSLDEWSTMSNIFECLPVWDIAREEDGDEEAADTTVASLGAFVTPSTNRPHCTPKDLFLFFKPLAFTSLSRALDILDVHLESGEILARWSVPAPLRWFLQSSGDVNEQRSWANRMARRAGGNKDRLKGQEDWDWLLEDMLKLTGNSDPTSRTAFCLLSREEVMGIFLSGLLSTGNFGIAKTMLQGPHSKITLSSEAIEAACLSCSRELYDNASSGNYKFGDMKLAFECLDVPRTSENIVKEKEFIEATSRICSFNVFSAPGTPISPIEIRLTKDRLSLVSRVLSSNNDAYRHTEVILDLCYKLGYRDDLVAEVKVLAMLADTALQAEDFIRAYENSERMVNTVSTLRNITPLGLGDPRVGEAAEVCWIACFQLGRQPEFQDLPKKMTLLGNALELCPPEKIHDVLTAWRRLETEDIQVREENLHGHRSGTVTTTSAHKLNSAPMNVASSLRARLQDFHVPSPPLLSTPDAAALASRTFKSVAANFPFSVGQRGRSHASDHDVDERGSFTSEGSRRTDEDVSSQASRVFSKGIGWLIGVEDET